MELYCISRYVTEKRFKKICIFEPLETAKTIIYLCQQMLWFAFKFVSLNHWKQQITTGRFRSAVVICFQICIFEPLETARATGTTEEVWLWFAFKFVSLNHWKQHDDSWKWWRTQLWFAFKFVSLNHWKQRVQDFPWLFSCCDLLSNLYLWTIGNSRR